MSQNITFAGNAYVIPDLGELNWGQNLTDYFVAIPTGALQTTGGAFSLSSEVDFGATYGLKSLYFKSRSANPASSGAIRLALGDSVMFRNASNTGDIPLGVNGANQLTWNGVVLESDTLPDSQMFVGNSLNQSTAQAITGAWSMSNVGVATINNNYITNVMVNSAAAIAYSKLNLALSIVNADVSASAAIAYSKLNLALSIVNADVSASAAIAYSKLNLATSIVNADVAAGAGIVYSKLSIGAGDIAYSKLTLTNSIVNNDVNASAGIVYSKLSLSNSIVNGDVATGAAIAVSKLAALTTFKSVVTDGSGVLSTGWAYASGNMATTSSGTLRLTDATTNFIGLGAPASVTSYNLKFPDVQGASGEVMRNDGSGNLSWYVPTGSGTVNSGLAGFFSYYAATGTAVDDQALLYTDGTRLLIGTTASRAVGSGPVALQLEGTSFQTASFSLVRNSNDTGGNRITFGKSRGTTIGGVTAVQLDDILGQVLFCGADGTDLTSQSASITAYIDGTVATGQVPGRLSFFTTPTGSGTMLERMRITSTGLVGINTLGSITSTFGGLDIQSGGLGLVLGADHGTTTRTNATTKLARIAAAHYTNAQTPVGMIIASNDIAENIVSFGGGSSFVTASTTINFFTAANNTTAVGSQRASINSSGQLLVSNGTVSLPGLSYLNDPDTGFYWYTSNNIAMSIGGVQTWELNSTAMYTKTPTHAPDGSAAAPTYSFVNDPDTGVARIAANRFALVTGGVSAWQVDSAAQWFTDVATATIRGADGSAALPAYSFNSDPDTGIYRTGTNTIGFASAGSLVLSLGSAQAYFLDGTAGSPGVSFLNDPDTGFYRINSGVIGIATNGGLRLAIDTVGVGVADGTISEPGLNFISDTNTGFFRPGADQLTLALGGTGYIRYTVQQTIVDNQLIGKGTATNDSANAGYIGERIVSAVGAVAAAATGVYGNVTSISLTAGDWDVSGIVATQASTVVTRNVMAISLFSGNTTTDHTNADNTGDYLLPTGGANGQGNIPVWRVSISSTTTVYLKARLTYASGSPLLDGRISARRVR
jgi:hypothetical protein